MQIFVKNLDGQTITLSVTVTDTIGDLKTKLYSDDRVKKELPESITDPSQLRIIFKGKQIDDSNSTLSDNNVQKDDTLHLVLCARGGAVKKNNIKLKSSKAPKVKITMRPTPISILAMEQATHAMISLSQTETVNVNEVLMIMSVGKLMELKEFMNNNQAHIDKKLDKVYEYTPLGEQLAEAHKMLEESKERLSFLVKHSFMEAYATIGDLNENIDKAITHKVSSSTAVPSAASAAPPAPPVAPPAPPVAPPAPTATEVAMSE